jgi:hypothetical protein
MPITMITGVNEAGHRGPRSAWLLMQNGNQIRRPPTRLPGVDALDALIGLGDGRAPRAKSLNRRDRPKLDTGPNHKIPAWLDCAIDPSRSKWKTILRCRGALAVVDIAIFGRAYRLS